MSRLLVDIHGAGRHREELRSLVTAVLSGEGCDEVEVCVSIVDSDTMVSLNRKYTGRAGPTDVLAFSMREGDGGLHSHGHLGDVVVCESQALEQARELGVDPGEELKRLVVHGVLHLLGYDHQTHGEKRRMESVQEAYVAGRWGE